MHPAMGSAAGSSKRVLLAPSMGSTKTAMIAISAPTDQPHQRTLVRAHAPGPPLSGGRVRPNSQPPREPARQAEMAHSPSFPLPEQCAPAQAAVGLRKLEPADHH